MSESPRCDDEGLCRPSSSPCSRAEETFPFWCPSCAAVVERGHDVTVVVGPSIRRPNPPPAASSRLVDPLREAGARVVQLLDEPLDPLHGFVLGSAIFGRTPGSLYGAVDAGRISRWSLPWAERLAPVIEQVQPDALVCDFFLYGALAAGEAAGTPTAALVHNCTIKWPLPGNPLPTPGSTPLGGPLGWARDRLWARAYRHVARREGATLRRRRAHRVWAARALRAPTRASHACRPRARPGNAHLRVPAAATLASERPLRRDDPRSRSIRALGPHRQR